MERQTVQALIVNKPDKSDPYPLLAVSEQKRSGLILCKLHYAEFAGPGAAISSLVDQDCEAIIAIGSPEIVRPVTHEERQKAYGRRIQWVRWLQKITDHPEPSQRAEKLFAGLEAFFGSGVLKLSDEVLALLAGVLPQTIALARLHFRHSQIGADLAAVPNVAILSPKELYPKYSVSSASPLPLSRFSATYSTAAEVRLQQGG